MREAMSELRNATKSRKLSPSSRTQQSEKLSMIAMRPLALRAQLRRQCKQKAMRACQNFHAHGRAAQGASRP